MAGPFKSVIRSFNAADSILNRLFDAVRTDLQPILDVFSESPAQAKIHWGKGVPSTPLPAGSVYFQIDAPTTAMSTMFVKRSGEGLNIWRTIPNGSGNLLYSSKDTRTLNGGAQTWTTAQSGPANGPTAMATDGSIQAAALTIYDKATEIPTPIKLTAGSLSAEVYVNGVSTGGIITLTPTTPGFAVFRYAVPGLIRFRAGDIISMSTAATGADAPGNAEIVCTMWGG